MKPLAIDLFCGLGGWTEGLIAEGYDVVGFDIEAHRYGDARYPAQLVIQDVLTIHGSQFKNAALIVASPPCQAFSWRAMPWKLSKAQHPDEIGEEIPCWWSKPQGEMGIFETWAWEAWKNEHPREAPSTALFDACFRIQAEAIAAAGHFIPLVVENVRGAQPWVGKAKWNFGSFYLWGDVPALMPIVTRSRKHFRDMGAKTPTGNCAEPMWKDRPIARLAHATPEEMERHGFKVPGFRFDGSGRSFQSASVADTKNTGGSWFAIGSPGQKVVGQNPDGRLINKRDGHRSTKHLTNPAEHAIHDGVKHHASGAAWFDGAPDKMLGHASPAKFSSKSNARKAASAAIAKIPFALSRHIAAAWKPDYSEIPPDSRQTVTSSAKGHEPGEFHENVSPRW